MDADKTLLLKLAKEISQNVEEGEYFEIYDEPTMSGQVEVGIMDWVLVMNIEHVETTNPASTGNILHVRFVPEHREFEGGPTEMIWSEDTVASWEDCLDVIGEYIAGSL